ncbi:MAG: YciI family protein [Myxococcota bacterium]
MNTYLLLLHETVEESGQSSPDEIQATIAEYSAWYESLKRADRVVDSGKLTDEGGRRIEGSGESFRVLDGPYAEGKEVVGGYFVIRAQDYDDAVAQSRSCPHVKYGWIEIRQIDVLSA